MKPKLTPEEKAKVSAGMAILGKIGGLKGGKSKSKAKQDASSANLAKARQTRLDQIALSKSRANSTTQQGER